MERRSSRRRRSKTRLGGAPTSDRSGGAIGWRALLIGAPLVYAGGTVLGHLIAVFVFGAAIGVFVSEAIVIVGCVLLSAVLARVIDRLESTDRPRSLAGQVSPRTSQRVGAAVLLPTFLFGFGLAVFG